MACPVSFYSATRIRSGCWLVGLAAASVLACSGTLDEEGGGDGDGHPGLTGDGDTSGTGSTPGAGGGLNAAGGTTGTGTGGFGPAGGSFSSGGTLGTGGMAPDLGPSHVVVVAHQDDDLLFINPELQRALDRGDALTTIYVTSGNAGMGMTYVTEREMGIRSAYSFMAGVSNSWSCGMKTFGGKSVNECTLNGAPDVELVFFRLVDGWGDGTDPNSLLNLWRGNIASSAAVDGSGLSFTREELVVSLADVFGQRGATHIHTTDFSFQNRQNDHSDHEHAALFTVAASARHSKPHILSSYITYSTKDWTPNLSTADTAIVQDAFSFYASCDSELEGCTGGPTCDQSTCSTSSSLYQSWYSRHYGFHRLSAPQAGSVSSGSSCLGVSGAQTPIVSCASAPSWTWNSDFSLQSPDGNCLTAPSLSDNSSLSLAPCTGSDRQKWFFMDNGLVVLGSFPNGGDGAAYELSQCLDASTGPGAAARVSNCGAAASQVWSL